MNVANLRQYLADLKRMLDVAGVKGPIIEDLAAIDAGLKPFEAHSLKDFADFLVRAEAFSRGEVPVKPLKGQRRTVSSPSTSKPKTANADLASLAQEAKRIYDQAPSESLTVEMIDALADRLKPLTTADLTTVAATLNLKVARSATKGKIVDAIRKWILDRKGSAQRAGLLDRPTMPRPTPAGGEGGGPAPGTSGR